MIGTIFLWCFWPSFNGAFAEGNEASVVVVNTVFSLCASCLGAFLVSSLLSANRRFSMVVVQNATLAGGVAVGAAANLAIQPLGASVIGALGGVASALWFERGVPLVERALGVADTCGVQALHGLPALIGGVAAIIVPAAAGDVAAATAQALALGVSVGAALVGGMLTGVVIGPLAGGALGRLKHADMFDDDVAWSVEAEDEA